MALKKVVWLFSCHNCAVQESVNERRHIILLDVLTATITRRQYTLCTTVNKVRCTPTVDKSFVSRQRAVTYNRLLRQYAQNRFGASRKEEFFKQRGPKSEATVHF